jgi:hypothetical protein
VRHGELEPGVGAGGARCAGRVVHNHHHFVVLFRGRSRANRALLTHPRFVLLTPCSIVSIISSVAHSASKLVSNKLKLSGIHLQENKMRAEFPIDTYLNIHVRIGHSPSEQKKSSSEEKKRERTVKIGVEFTFRKIKPTSERKSSRSYW